MTNEMKVDNQTTAKARAATAEAMKQAGYSSERRASVRKIHTVWMREQGKIKFRDEALNWLVNRNVFEDCDPYEDFQDDEIWRGIERYYFFKDYTGRGEKKWMRIDPFYTRGGVDQFLLDARDNFLQCRDFVGYSKGWEWGPWVRLTTKWQCCALHGTSEDYT